MNKFILILCLTFIPLFGLNAQTIGDLDPSFDFDGKVIFGGNREEIAYAMEIQPDGKIIVGGSVFQTGTTSHFLLLRYNSDGSLDSDFGTNGLVETTITGTEDVINSIVIQADNKIVVGGTSWYENTRYDFVVARYNTNGSIDNSFGNNGVTHFDLNLDDDKVNILALQPDGKILAGGLGGNLMLIRLRTDGIIDSTFGLKGVAQVSINGSVRVRGLVVQSDEKILAVGVKNESDNDVTLARYLSDGTLDVTFGSAGFVVTQKDLTDEESFAALLQSDGKIISIGTQTENSKINVQLLRYNNDGSLDNSFGTDGIATVNNQSNEEAFSAVLQPDGKIVTAGYSYNSTDQAKDFLIMRFNTNGNLDNTFGNAGRITTDFSNKDDDIAFAIARQTDGKLVAAGYTTGLPNLAIARYLTELNNSIREDSNAEIDIYPTPANDFIMLSMGAMNPMLQHGIDDNNEIQIFNTLGEKVMSELIHTMDTSHRVNIESLPKGMYFVKFGGETAKFVKL